MRVQFPPPAPHLLLNMPGWGHPGMFSQYRNKDLSAEDVDNRSLISLSKKHSIYSAACVLLDGAIAGFAGSHAQSIVKWANKNLPITDLRGLIHFDDGLYDSIHIGVLNHD